MIQRYEWWSPWRSALRIALPRDAATVVSTASGSPQQSRNVHRTAFANIRRDLDLRFPLTLKAGGPAVRLATLLPGAAPAPLALTRDQGAVLLVAVANVLLCNLYMSIRVGQARRRQREHLLGRQQRHGVQIIVSGNHLGGGWLETVIPIKCEASTTAI